MLTLSRARKRAAKAGDPLPTVFHSLAREGVHFRQSQLTLIAAAPGVGKSLLSVTLALKARVPTFYCSADSDEHTMYTRIGAIETGWDAMAVDNIIRNQADGIRHIEEVVARSDHLRWSFHPDPDTLDLEADLTAMAGIYGEWPRLIVVDNLRDLYLANEDDREASLNDRCKYLKVVARETGAAVVALHHVTGEYDDGNKPVPMSGLIDKVSKIPECILTLDRAMGVVRDDGSSVMNVRPVKNRGGKADASGAWSLPLRAYMDRMTLEG